MITGLQSPRGLTSPADHEAVTLRVAALTDAQSQQVLQFLAGLSPAVVDMAITAIEALQPGPDQR
jgi:hypothetical protein